jgi:hypothetical protein
MMNQLWKFSKIMLMFALVIGLVACGTDETQKVETKKIEQTKEKTKKQEKKEDVQTETETKTETETNAMESNSNEVVNKTETTEKNVETPINTTTTTPTKKPANSTTTAPPTAPPSTPAPPPPVQTNSVTISIEGPEGTIVGAKKVNFESGATVLDTLITLAGKSNVDYSGSGDTAYVHGLYNVYEFDHGPTSGWTYKYNGVIVSKSAGAVKVNNGDSITWIYKKS